MENLRSIATIEQARGLRSYLNNIESGNFSCALCYLEKTYCSVFYKYLMSQERLKEVEQSIKRTPRLFRFFHKSDLQKAIRITELQKKALEEIDSAEDCILRLADLVESE